MKNNVFKNMYLWVFVIFIFIINLQLLNSFNIWRDEAFTINVAKHSIMEIGGIVAKDVHPPLHLYVLHFWMEIFGDSAFSVRFLSLLIGLLIPVVGYKLAKELNSDFKNKNSFIVFVVLMIVTAPFYLLQSIESRAYSMLMLAEIGVIYSVVKSIQNTKLNKYDVSFVLFATLGLYSHVIFLFSFMAVFIWNVGLFIKKVINEKIKGKKFLKFLGKYAIIYFVVFLIFLPWISQLIKQILQINDQGFWLQFNPIPDLLNSFSLFFTTSNVNEGFHTISPLPKYFVSLFGPVLLLFGTFKRDQKYYLGSLVFLTLAIIFIASFKNPIYYIRYIAFLVPVIMIVVTEGIFSISTAFSSKISKVILIIFLLSNVYLFYGNIMQDKNLKSDYVGAISYILSTDPNTQVIHPHGYTLHSFTYYAPKMGIEQGLLYDPNRTNPHFEGLAAFNDSDYYDILFPGDLEKIWVPAIFDDKNFNNHLIKNGFIVILNKDFNGGLNIKLWKKID